MVLSKQVAQPLRPPTDDAQTDDFDENFSRPDLLIESETAASEIASRCIGAVD